MLRQWCNLSGVKYMCFLCCDNGDILVEYARYHGEYHVDFWSVFHPRKKYRIILQYITADVSFAATMAIFYRIILYVFIMLLPWRYLIGVYYSCFLS